MSIRRARAILSPVWSIGVAGLLLFLIVRQLAGLYGTDTKDLWVWVSQFVLPGMTVIAGAWTVKAGADEDLLRTPYVFWSALGITLFYLLIVFLSVLYEPLTGLPWKEALKQSALYLGLVQGLAVGVLTKFFVESGR